MVEGISRQYENESVVWLLLVMLMQVYSEKEQMGKKDTKYSLERKIAPGRLMMPPRHVPEKRL